MRFEVRGKTSRLDVFNKCLDLQSIVHSKSPHCLKSYNGITHYARRIGINRAAIPNFQTQKEPTNNRQNPTMVSTLYQGSSPKWEAEEL